MTEAAVLEEAAGLAVPVRVPAESAGTLLRRAREAAGLRVGALAVSLKVPEKKLESLEADRYDELPGPVFTRALASSMCRSLGIDPAPVLERLPQGVAPRLVLDTEAINEPFRVPGEGRASGLRERATQPVSLVVGCLLIGVLVLLALPLFHRDLPVVKPAAVAAPAAAPVVQQAQAPVSGAQETPPPDAVPAQVQASAESVAPHEPEPVSAPARTPAPIATAPAPATATASAPVAAAPAAAVATPVPAGIVGFRATGETWVQVTDAKGAVALRKMLAAGESASASGALPLHVTVGRSDRTQVDVRGKPFDMRPFDKDNVARFEVK